MEVYICITFLLLALTLLLYFFITRKQKYLNHDPGNIIMQINKIFRDTRINIIFIIMTIIMLFYVASEFIISNWTPTFFRLEMSFDVQMAGTAALIFWATVIIGRIIFVGKLHPLLALILIILKSLI